MENEAGPSRPKRPHQLVLGTEIEDLLLEEDDTGDDFIYNDEEESSSDDDDDDDDDHSQPPTLQLPTHRRVSPVCEIESPSHQDFEETGPPSSSSDQLLSFYPCERKTVRWYLKIAIHIFQLLLINSYKMYNKYTGKPKMRLYGYRLSVIDNLLPKKTSDDLQMPRRGNPTHTITRITEKNSNGRIKQKHCRQCYKQKKRSDTTWHCVACNDKPGLCVECFDLYHEEL
ncbi:PiggyBac transposable element-derived protein 4 [Eumeta japonica]|uniref:PiggyBac transposable element-derived protein 4 n=1 Tax=Eumeta variegata TaxID=151549 RepID=A0A4C1SRP0_EUMVA|nr:PiggyBac transposable element-derived protein 4 [Eumeta japonica]